jgi:hypothetical protein
MASGTEGLEGQDPRPKDAWKDAWKIIFYNDYVWSLENSVYPEGLIRLIVEDLLKPEMLALDGIGDPPSEPLYYCIRIHHYYIRKIQLPVSAVLVDLGIHPEAVLIHELTHYLQNTQEENTQEVPRDYNHFMRLSLLEEVIALDSENSTPVEKMTDPFKPPFRTLNEDQVSDLENFFYRFYCKIGRARTRLANVFSENDEKNESDVEILIKAAIYFMVSCSVHREEDPSWIMRFTKFYNADNQTNHTPPENGFEPPMLPPTLARLALEVFKQIPEDQRDEHPVWKDWQAMTGMDWATLELAAAQTKWPTYPSQVLEGIYNDSNYLR